MIEEIENREDKNLKCVLCDENIEDTEIHFTQHNHPFHDSCYHFIRCQQCGEKRKGCELEYNDQKGMITCRFCDGRPPRPEPRVDFSKMKDPTKQEERTVTMWRIPPKEEVFKILMRKKLSGLK